MKSNKNIIILFSFFVIVLLTVIAVFLVNKNSVNNLIKDENVQVDTLSGIYTDMLNTINTENISIVLDESALKNVLTDESFTEESALKLRKIERSVENSQSTYTLYVKYSKDTYTISINIIETGIGKTKINQKYKLNVKDGKINFERDGHGTVIEE